MLSVADVVVARLRDAGVRCVFGMPGGGSNLDLVDACGRAGVRFVLTATETGAAIAAVAQAEITGRPGACLTTLGPGVASVVNGVACARLERAPLIVFTDAPAAGASFEHQRIDHRALLAPITKWSATISGEPAREVVDRAIACAMAEPRGPVHIDCPADALSRRIESLTAPHTTSGGGVASGASSPAPRAPFELAHNRKPILLIGLGARDAATAAAIRALCSERRIPAMVTYKAKGVVADVDPWFAGVFTNGAIERPIVDTADLIATIGFDRVELLPRPWPYSQPLLELAASDVADFRAAIGPSSWDAAALQGMVAQHRASIRGPSDGLSPDRVVEIAAEAAPRARVTVDAGAHMLAATMLWPIDEPHRMLISNGLSTMGFALPAAIGAALLPRIAESTGNGLDEPPSRRAPSDGSDHVIALTGDGGLLMCVGELATAAREGAKVIVVVFNDAALSLIDIKQSERRLTRRGVDIGSVDWRALAEGVGVAGHTATVPAELAHALAAALRHRGPSLIDVRIDASGYPTMLKAIRG